MHASWQVAKEELTVGSRLSADRELSLDELDSKLEDMERELLELNANSERLTRRCLAHRVLLQHSIYVQ